MNSELFHILFGACALASIVSAAAGVLRRSPHAPFRLVTAGLLAGAFFVSLPAWPAAGVAVAALLVTVGFVIAKTDDGVDLFDASTTRRRR